MRKVVATGGPQNEEVHVLQGDLSKTTSHEPGHEWPSRIEIRALWKTAKGGHRVRSIHISGDQFFGHGQFGAPMNGDQLIAMIERLRKL